MGSVDLAIDSLAVVQAGDDSCVGGMHTGIRRQPLNHLGQALTGGEIGLRARRDPDPWWLNQIGETADSVRRNGFGLPAGRKLIRG